MSNPDLNVLFSDIEAAGEKIGRKHCWEPEVCLYFVVERPRETLEFETPAERLMHVLHRPVEVTVDSIRILLRP